MTKALVWNCTIQATGTKSLTGPTTAEAQQGQATLTHGSTTTSWSEMWKTSCGGMKAQPCQPEAEIGPSLALP